MMKLLRAIKRFFDRGPSQVSKIKVEQPAYTPTAPPNLDVPASKGALWYPKALKVTPPLKTKGKYAKKYPIGAVIHFTAGRHERGVENAKNDIEGARKNNFVFVCIPHKGPVVQAHPVNEWGNHAGKSAWSGIFGTVSDDLIGIEMNCAGKLTKTKDGRFKTSFGTYIDPSEVRYVTEKEYGCPTGYYHKYSEEQERNLIELLIWLKRNDPYGVFNVDLILGHHEVAGMKGLGFWRKDDPGGSLSMPMSELRALIKSRV